MREKIIHKTSIFILYNKYPKAGIAGVKKQTLYKKLLVLSLGKCKNVIERQVQKSSDALKKQRRNGK